jgi:hypothetical protein
MENSHINRDSTGFKFLQIGGLFLRLLGFVLVGQTLAVIIISLALGISMESLSLRIQNASLEQKNLLLLVQGLGMFLAFIVMPILYVHFFKKDLYRQFHSNNSKLAPKILYSILILIASVPLISIIQELNKMIDFPDTWNIESWMRSKEDLAKNLTEIIVSYDTVSEFLIALIVIAILPAIGEELLFRGIFQNELKGILKNPHAAIWITGFVFSALHLQFYGFLPRMMLGVIFGYLYYWSGNLIVPMIVHFLNNALTLLAVNLYRQKTIDIDPESAASFPLVIIIFSSIVFIFLLFTFKKLGTKHRDNSTQG